MISTACCAPITSSDFSAFVRTSCAVCSDSSVFFNEIQVQTFSLLNRSMEFFRHLVLGITVASPSSAVVRTGRQRCLCQYFDSSCQTYRHSSLHASIRYIALYWFIFIHLSLLQLTLSLESSSWSFVDVMSLVDRLPRQPSCRLFVTSVVRPMWL